MAFVIHNTAFEIGYRERQQINLELINGNANNTILMYDQTVSGEKGLDTFWSGDVDVVDRDTSVSVNKPESTLGQLEQINIKVPFRSNLMTIKLEDIYKTGYTEAQYSAILGGAYADGELSYKMQAIVAAIKAATVQAGTDNNTTATAVDIKTLNSLRRLMGDKSSAITTFLMPSSAYFDLSDSAITANRLGESGLVAYGEQAGTLGRSTLVSDISGLDDGTSQWILALTAGAVELKNNSRPPSVISRNNGAGENHTLEWSAEGSFNLKVKGSSFVGAANATLASLGSSVNWLKVATSHKAMAACMVKVN